VVAATGVILAAAYMLWMYQRVMFGELTKPENKVLKDLSAREILVLSSVTLFIFWIGIYPQTFLSRMEPTVQNYLAQVQNKYQAGLRIQEGEKIILVKAVPESEVRTHHSE
jgi:NADH-quinone oxidoreductase subunit M